MLCFSGWPKQEGHTLLRPRKHLKETYGTVAVIISAPFIRARHLNPSSRAAGGKTRTKLPTQPAEQGKENVGTGVSIGPAG